ncbi:MAG: MATE family efflux transporter [Bacillota bacterium]
MTQQHHVADMGEEKISNLLMRFSLPATLALAVMASYNIVDAAFVGRLGSDAIAALSISFPIQMLFGAIGVGTGVGAASLISRSLGAHRNEEAVIAAGQVIMIALALGISTTLIGLFALEPLLMFFGATPEILQQTVDYMLTITNGAVMLFMIMMLNQTVRAEGNAILPMFVMILSAVLNIVLDPIFIFMLGMGIRGAAIATVLAKAIGAVILLWYYIAGRSALKVRFSHLRPHGQTMLNIYKVGLPTLFLQMSANISLIVANRILGSFGFLSIAVMGLAFRLQMFALMPAIGIAQGIMPIIGYNFGADKPKRIRETMIKGAISATLLVIVLGLAFFLFPRLFLRVFSNDAALLAGGMEAIRIMVVMYPLLSLPLIGGAFFQGVGKGTPALFLSLMRQFIAYIPLLLLLPRFFGLIGIWLATPLADLLTFLLSIILISREFRRRTAQIASAPR